MSKQSDFRFETMTVQGGYTPENGGPRITPLVQSTTYKYDDVQSVADLFDLKREGYFYSRLANPTVDALARKLAALEGGVGCVCTSSGQAANTLAILNIAKAGDHVLACATIYGGTFSLYSNTLKKCGIDFSFVPPTATPEEIQAAIRPNTKAIFGETLANPALEVLDIEKFAKVAHANGLPLIVDNTFPTPFLCNPFKWGADIIVHSTTKYLDGHASSLGGAIIEKGGFPWDNGKFPEMVEPDESYHGLSYMKNFPEAPYTAKQNAQGIRDYGNIMAPMNAFLTMLGTETLHVRMERHCSNALEMARILQSHPAVAWVNYPGLPSSSQHELAKKYLPKGCSGVLTFGLKGGRAAGERAMNNLKLAAIVVHVADVRTCVLHPASMTHRQLSDEQLVAAGVSPDLIRLSIGIENIEDLKADFDQAFKA